MESKELRLILQNLQKGETTVDDVIERLRHLPYEDIGCATIDHHRALRQGFPEVVFGESKSVSQIRQIIAALVAKGSNVLATRLSVDKARQITEDFPLARYH
ncbi:MAG: 1-(5-phosphoribosyl)-5-amino-4-imidazole-carboxylate carboxylase, partial [Geobacteraceae bacterium]|nr:1-(5-phosphoribosyl)-5-amino-4-imidazole-carboxylate carboxylase [Geobacteraceae bacterium]